MLPEHYFNISIAWAITIHKSQGLSLDGVLVDLGLNIFEAGMSYVALSRARSLKNVYLIDFEPSSLNCNVKAVYEYNRLRKKFQPSFPIFLNWNILPDKKKDPLIYNKLLAKSSKQLNYTLEKKKSEKN
jgi:hypothetical protein